MANPSIMLVHAMTLYLVGTVLTAAGLSGRGPRASQAGLAATVVVAVGIIPHTVGLLGLVAHTGRAPYSTIFGAFAFLAWLLAVLQVGAVARWRLYALGAVSLPLAFLMLLYALALPPEMHELLPALHRHTMAAHISVTLLGYGAFAVSFGLAVIYLLEERMLKARQLHGVIEKLPPLRTAEELASRFAAFGYAMLTLGIATGIAYALRDWGSRFWSDPKVAPALVTWGIYTLYHVLRWAAGWRGRAAAYLLVAGFVAVLITFVGVNALYPGAHGAIR